MSERWFLKYLFTPEGACLGVDLRDRSYLFLASKRGVVLQRRPVGDRVVEDLDYRINAIAAALAQERAAPRGPPRMN